MPLAPTFLDSTSESESIKPDDQSVLQAIIESDPNVRKFLKALGLVT